MAPPELSAVTGPSACCTWIRPPAVRATTVPAARSMRMLPPPVEACTGPCGLMNEDLAARRLEPRFGPRVLHSNSAAAGETSHRPAHAAHFNVAARSPQFTVAPNAIQRDPPAARASFHVSIPVRGLHVSAARFSPHLPQRSRSSDGQFQSRKKPAGAE